MGEGGAGSQSSSSLPAAVKEAPSRNHTARFLRSLTHTEVHNVSHLVFALHNQQVEAASFEDVQADL